MKQIVHHLFRTISICLLSAILFTTALGDQSPVTMLQNMVNRVLQQLSQNRSILGTAKGKAVIKNSVDSIVVPNVNVNYMAGAVVGRYHWRKATPAQRKKFVSEFKDLVISNYSAALAEFDDDKVEFYPLRNGSQSKTVNVKSVIVRKNGQRIAIDYLVSKSGSDWKIFDFSIENVSMISSYRSQFADVLSQGGLPLLIQKLETHNQASGN